ncbi:hypothetical protein [Coxiella-like endosymbiont of Rhipicephalus sanguineus]|uniref:hypothetical protein n=1 Tax=Coxiella-like endosymbiont of Rhipicephalus sanguineus TaxID=1955402 RepID=UPI00203D8008|nr:hypothetical protein [Coxiella-like endosymbiont of Rhipicephalus sanguineus]
MPRLGLLAAQTALARQGVAHAIGPPQTLEPSPKDVKKTVTTLFPMIRQKNTILI